MKIAIACHPNYGGSGVVASELGMGLAKNGHEVHFVSYQAPFRVDRWHEGVHVHEVEVTSYPLFKYPPYALALANKLLEVVRENGVKILHVHYAIPHSISAILAQQMCADCGVKVMTTLHGTDITLVGGDRSFFEITRFGIEKSDVVTAVSDDLACETRRQFDVERAIEVVPNFVDTDLYRPEARSDEIREAYAQPDEALLVHVSNFRPVKRTQDVVEVFHRVSRDMPARLLMVGTGPEVAAAEELARSLGIADRISFTGGVVGVSELLACADLFLLPSEAESFGLAALEAMSCGVPVIGTEAGGLPEVVESGVSGHLFPVGDVDAMSRMALDILQDSELHRRFREGARRRAVEVFPRDRVVALYQDLYRQLDGSD